MKHARESSVRPAAAAVATAAADTVAGVKVASEEAATRRYALLPADSAVESAVSADSRLLPIDLDSARYSSTGQIWAGLDSNQRRRKASRFTVCPVWPLRYLPAWSERFIYPRASQLATGIAFRGC